MKNKRRQPREGLVEPEYGEYGPGESFLDTGSDVQGHGLPVPAPPSGIQNRGTSHGGEAVPQTDESTAEA